MSNKTILKLNQTRILQTGKARCKIAHHNSDVATDGIYNIEVREKRDESGMHKYVRVIHYDDWGKSDSSNYVIKDFLKYFEVL